MASPCSRLRIARHPSQYRARGRSRSGSAASDLRTSDMPATGAGRRPERRDAGGASLVAVVSGVLSFLPAAVSGVAARWEGACPPCAAHSSSAQSARFEPKAEIDLGFVSSNWWINDTGGQGVPASPLELHFHQDMQSDVEAAKREIGYNPTRFMYKVGQYGAAETAGRLLASGVGTSDSFTTLYLGVVSG